MKNFDSPSWSESLSWVKDGFPIVLLSYWIGSQGAGAWAGVVFVLIASFLVGAWIREFEKAAHKKGNDRGWDNGYKQGYEQGHKDGIRGRESNP